jgi:hypothetical protein
MSKIQHPVAETSTKTSAAASLTEPLASDLSLSESKDNDTYTTRVVFEANATARQLESGVVVQLANGKNVFTSSEKDDVAKGILTSISVKSIYSDCSEPVTFSLNLFNTSGNEPSIKNNVGWLHAPQRTDFGTEAVSADEHGYRNLLNVMPYEKSRTELSVYHPEDLVDNRMVKQYSSCSSENLYDGVVAFPGEQYYLVENTHVVLDVIRSNWQQLGINLDDEHKFNGKYVQVPAHIFDRVIGDLQSQVLSRMPFTNLNDVRAKFASKPTSHYVDVHPDGESGKYKICVELQMNYQFPASQEETSAEE